MTTEMLQKTADDYTTLRSLAASPWSRLLVSPHPYQAHIDRLRESAAVLNYQLQRHEAYRMAQTVENLGGPGTGRSRYIRAVMSNPYQMSPLLPYMAGGPMGPLGPMGLPMGAGVDQYAPPDINLPEPGQSDPELTALEQGITRTASVRADVMSQALAKMAANEFNGYEEVPPQYMPPQYMPPQYMPPQYAEVAAPQLPPSQAQQAGQYTASAASHLGRGLGDAAMAAGHGIRAVGGSVGRGLSSFARGMREFMSTDQQGGQRWGAGMPPAAMTNEYGQPIYG